MEKYLNCSGEVEKGYFIVKCKKKSSLSLPEFKSCKLTADKIHQRSVVIKSKYNNSYLKCEQLTAISLLKWKLTGIQYLGGPINFLKTLIT